MFVKQRIENLAHCQFLLCICSPSGFMLCTFMPIFYFITKLMKLINLEFQIKKKLLHWKLRKIELLFYRMWLVILIISKFFLTRFSGRNEAFKKRLKNTNDFSAVFVFASISWYLPSCWQIEMDTRHVHRKSYFASMTWSSILIRYFWEPVFYWSSYFLQEKPHHIKINA